MLATAAALPRTITRRSSPGSAECHPARTATPCVRQITRRLLMLYAEFSATPPAGLSEFAQRTGVTAGEELP